MVCGGGDTEADAIVLENAGGFMSRCRMSERGHDTAEATQKELVALSDDLHSQASPSNF